MADTANTISYTFKKIRVFTDPSIPDHENVISKVDWTVEFTDGVNKAIAGGTSNIDTSNLQNFIPAENVTDELLMQWCVGNNIKPLLEFHSKELEKMAKESKLVLYYGEAIQLSQQIDMPNQNIAGTFDIQNLIANNQNQPSSNEIFEAPIL